MPPFYAVPGSLAVSAVLPYNVVRTYDVVLPYSMDHGPRRVLSATSDVLDTQAPGRSVDSLLRRLFPAVSRSPAYMPYEAAFAR